MGWLRDLFAPGQETLERTTDAGDSEDVFDTAISDFWAGLRGVGFSPYLIDRVWVAERCLHLNSQQISRMPLRFFGTSEPAWTTNPDPHWFPNGIGDAVYAMVSDYYGWGDTFLNVTSRYADGYPSFWTVLSASTMTVELREGVKQYRFGNQILNPADVVQISRNPKAGSLRGTSALRSYSAYIQSLLSSSDMGRVMMDSGVPSAVLKSKRKIGPEQAQAIQNAWITATAARHGSPAILGPDLEFEQLAFSPADLMLLDVQAFDAKVIASAFGVPAYLLNLAMEGSLLYQNPQQLLEGWWRVELSNTGDAITDALSSNWLPRGNSVVFDPREVLAPTFKELAETVVGLVDKGLISAGEGRAMLKLSGDPGSAVAQLTQPASAGATPAQQEPSSVVALRPTQVVSQ